MGVRSKNLLIEAANIQNYMFEFVDDFLKSLGVKSEKEIDEAYRLIDEFERLTSQKEKQTFTGRLTDEQKKLMNGVNKLEQGTGVRKQDLIDILKAGSNKDQRYSTKIDQFADLIFRSPGLKDAAIASFKKVNKEAQSWDIFLSKSIEDFTSIKQINDWATSRIETINNSEIPQYIKEYYIDLITNNSQKLKDSFKSWIGFRTNKEYSDIVNSLPKDSQNNFDRMVKNIYEKRMSDNTLEGLMSEVKQISKIYGTNVQNWTKEETKSAINNILKMLNDGTSIENAVLKYKKELDQFLHQNPDALSRFCRETWINKPETEKASLLSNAFGMMFSPSMSKQFPMPFKWNKCALMPLIIITMGITMGYGVSVWLQFDESSKKIAEKVPVVGEYLGIFTPKMQQEIIDELFPNLRFLTFPVLLNREVFFKLINRTDTADESEKQAEPVKPVLKISLNGGDYTLHCEPQTSREERNNPSNWVVIKDDGTTEKLSVYEGQYDSQNEFVAYANEQINNDSSEGYYLKKRIPNFTIKDYYVVSTVPDIVEVYRKNDKNNVFEFKKDQNGNWVSLLPTEDEFLDWILSDEGTKEEWGPSTENTIGLESDKKRYVIRNVKNQYIINDTKRKYKEIYVYDLKATPPSFKFIKTEEL